MSTRVTVRTRMTSYAADVTPTRSSYKEEVRIRINHDVLEAAVKLGHGGMNNEPLIGILELR